MGIWNNIVGTTSTFFKIGLSGVRLKDSSGNLLVRNAGDTADATVTTSKLNVSGDTIDLNSDAAGSGADYKYTLQRPTVGMTSAVTLTLPTDDGTPGQVIQTDGNGALSWASAGDTSLAVKTDTTTLAFGTVSPAAMFTKPANAIVHQIDFVIDTSFNGTAPTVSVGIAGTTSKYAGIGDVNLKGVSGDVYTIFPGVHAVGNTEALILSYSADSSTAGSARVLVYYSIPA